MSLSMLAGFGWIVFLSFFQLSVLYSSHSLMVGKLATLQKPVIIVAAITNISSRFTKLCYTMKIASMGIFRGNQIHI